MKWKKWALAGFGSLALGTVAVLAGKRFKKQSTVNAVAIEEDIEDFLVETQPHPVVFRGIPYLSQTSYLCRSTRFRVWSILDLSNEGETDTESSKGQRIYHVVPTVRIRTESGEEVQMFGEEKFYGTLQLKLPSGGSLVPDHLATGCHLIFGICHVGGSLNGVPTGEERVTGSPIAGFEFPS